MTSSSAGGSMPLSKGVMKEREMPVSVSSVYINVVDHVIKSLRPDFQNDGVDDSVLNEVQSLWELKMMQTGVIQGPIDRNANPSARGTNGPPITPVHDLNVPYEATEEYQTPTAEMLFPPTPAMETPMQTPLPGNTEPVMYQYLPPASSQLATYPDSTNTVDAEAKIGRPTPYMQQPSSWMSQKPVVLDVNIAYEEDGEEAAAGISQPVTKDFFNFSGAKRKRDEQSSNYLPGSGFIPQQDGAGDFSMAVSFSKEEVTANKTLRLSSVADSERQASDAIISGLIKAKYGSAHIPQVDGNDDAKPTEEDHNESADQEDEEPLNDNDDDPDDAEQINGDSKTDDLVLAQFEKVSRTKNRWKCTLKDGIMHVNNKDILFSKATGEFDF